MAAKDLLSIIDDDGGLALRTMHRRDADVELRVTGGNRGFVDSMDALVKDGQTFKRAVFTTHGNSGTIFFRPNYIGVDELKRARSRRYDLLFPDYNTGILFAGCNVADGDAGWDFLEAAAKTFLGAAGGGLVMGYTSVGFSIPSWFWVASPITWLKSRGHVLHLWGDLRGVWMVNGIIIRRFAEASATA